MNVKPFITSKILFDLCRDQRLRVCLTSIVVNRVIGGIWISRSYVRSWIVLWTALPATTWTEFYSTARQWPILWHYIHYICQTYNFPKMDTGRRNSNVKHPFIPSDTSEDSDITRNILLLCRSQWPHRLRCGSTAARLLGLRVRILTGAWMSVSCVYVRSGRGLLRRPDHSSKGVLLSVVCLSVI
jgi:hypothetical protein